MSGLDALLDRLAAPGTDHEGIETYSNGVRHVKVPAPAKKPSKVEPAVR